MKKIAVITARAGSKGLPNKNVLLANGKPLIAYTIEEAMASECFEKIIVSTDSQEYIDLLSKYSIDFIRREEHLATDTASSFVVIEDVLRKTQNIDYEYFALLQPTSPLRTAGHIQEACEKFERNFKSFDYLVSVVESSKSTALIKEIDNDESLKHFDLDYSNYARQKFFPEYTPNGAIFMAKPTEYLTQKHFFGKRSLAYKMDRISSLDIDSYDDFEYFYFILQQRNKAQILLNNIKNRIEFKRNWFEKKAEITLIGHSILDQWNIKELSEKSVNNLGISGISTREYLGFIIDKNLITQTGDIIILMHGTNDIVKPNWTKERVLSDIQELIDKLLIINEKSKIFFLEITPTAFRLDRNNDNIINMNIYLKRHLKNIQWVDLYRRFSDSYGNINLEYSNDGLHLNEKGYELLKEILETYL